MKEKEVQGKTTYVDGILPTLLKDVGIPKEERGKWKEVKAIARGGKDFSLLIQKEDPGGEENNYIALVTVVNFSSGKSKVVFNGEEEFNDYGLLGIAVPNTPAFLALLPCKMADVEYRDTCSRMPTKEDKDNPLLQKSSYDQVHPPYEYESMEGEEEENHEDDEDYDDEEVEEVEEEDH